MLRLLLVDHCSGFVAFNAVSSSDITCIMLLIYFGYIVHQSCMRIKDDDYDDKRKQ